MTRRPSTVRAWSAAAILLLLTAGTGRAGTTNSVASTAAILCEQWGVEITSLRLSARGRMVDFRYRVLDPIKAATLAKREFKPQLLDQATGAILTVPTTPKLGPLRQSATQLIQGKIYFALFANTRCMVKSGSQVTVVIGPLRVENLTVQ